MTIRHLKIFVAICEEGGVTKAAKALHVAQPAVSFTLSEIEKYYSVTLFERVHGRLVITEAGKELLLKAKDTLAAFEDFEKTAFHADDHPALRIGSSLTLGKTRLPSLLKRLKDTFPEVGFQVRIDKTKTVEEALSKGDLDFAIVEGKVVSPALSSTPFSKDRLVAVCEKSYPIESETSLTTLCRHPLLLREVGSASRDLWDSALLSHALNVTPMMESVSNEAILSSVEQGLGIAILPEELVSPYLTAGSLRKITIPENDFKREAFFLTNKNKKYSSLQKKIIAFTVKEILS